MANFPLTIRKESARATLYRLHKKDGYTSYCLHWYENKERKRRTFSSRKEAIQEANKLLEQILAGSPELATLGRDDAIAYAAARELIKDTGMPLVTVCREYMRTWTPDFKKASVRAVIRKRMEASNDLSEKHKDDLRFRLAAFEKDFGHRMIDDISAAEVKRWIESRRFKGQPVGNRTRGNWLRMLCGLWSYARESGHLIKDRRHRLQDIKNWRYDPASYSCMAHGDLLLLRDLCHAHKGRDQLLPFLYLMAFAGLRTAEAKRLTYEDLVIRNGQVEAININVKQSKTQTRRSIPALPAFASHMREFAVLWKRKGSIAKWKKIDLILHRIAKNNTVQPLQWQHNQLRHTFATHLLRQWKDPAKVAEYLGTSPSMINSHYRELTTPEETKAWMGMRDTNPRPAPPLDPNVPPF